MRQSTPGIRTLFRMPVFIPLMVALFAASVGPLVAHVLWCIDMATETWQALVLLVAGLALPPVGWVHGVSVLIGFGGWL